jgi:hypothetical protein
VKPEETAERPRESPNPGLRQTVEAVRRTSVVCFVTTRIFSLRMRVPTLIVLCCLVVLLAGWTSVGAALAPPTCSAAQTQRRAVLTAGEGPGGSARYYRYCGRGHAFVRLAGKTFAIQGGRCGRRVSGQRWVYFGLITNGVVPKGATGLSLVMIPGNRPGTVEVVDSIVQVAGLNLAPAGTTTLAKDLNSGTFVLRSGAKRVTGYWSCL